MSHRSVIKFLAFLTFAAFLAGGCNLVAASPTASVETPVFPTETPAGETPAVTQAPEQPTDTPSVATDTPAVSTPPTEVTSTGSAPTQETPASVPLTIAYIKAGSVWLWTEGGSPRQLTSSGQDIDVRISDDGQVVAFLRGIDEFRVELWAINADSSNERQLVSTEELSAVDPEALAVVPYQFEFVPGSHTLAYNHREVMQGPGLIQYDDLNLVNADSGEKQVLLPAGQGGDFYYSPDGSQIAISTSQSIFLVNADGSNRRHVLDFPRVNTASEYLFYPKPAWAPDSSRLAAAIPPTEPFQTPVQPTTTYSISLDGSPAVQLGQLEALYFPGAEWISPDLQRVLYTAAVGAPEENMRQIHIANLDGSGDALIQEGENLFAQGWIDPSSFVYTSGNNGELFLVQSGSGVPASLGVGVFNFKPAGMGRIAYFAQQGTDWNLAVWQVGQADVIDSFVTTPVMDLTNSLP